MEQLLQASVGMISGDREEKLSTGKRPLYFEGKIFCRTGFDSAGRHTNTSLSPSATTTRGVPYLLRRR
jgi:hypothetical protein